MIIIHSGGYDNELISILRKLVREKDEVIEKQEKHIVRQDKLIARLLKAAQLSIDFFPN